MVLLMKTFFSRDIGLKSMPSEADMMRAFCVEASVAEALQSCGRDLVAKHGLPAGMLQG
jgi:hypothetical protein